MNTKTTAKDFFLHLGAIATFYASAIALITLLFEVINFAYPKITNAYQYYFPSISFQVATLIVAFPLFLLLSWLLQKSYAADPSLRDAPIRKLLSYLTLFVAGAVVAGDLITLIYMFLDGQELTMGFVLKVVALLVIAGGVFVYYLREIRNQIGGGERSGWRVAALVVIVASIVLGFMVIGSPASQRARRYDNQRVSDLQNIQWQIVNYYQRKGSIPSNLGEIEDPISSYMVPTDPKTHAAYEYRIVGQSALAFELCASFEREGQGMGYYGIRPMMVSETSSMPAHGLETWEHGAGRTCFNRSIDPELYPLVKPVR
jgi:hypothetical protein